jgi:hypothetical protein
MVDKKYGIFLILSLKWWSHQGSLCGRILQGKQLQTFVCTCHQIAWREIWQCTNMVHNNTWGKLRKNAQGRWRKKKRRTKLHFKLAFIFHPIVHVGTMKNSSCPNMWENLFIIWYFISCYTRNQISWRRPHLFMVLNVLPQAWLDPFTCGHFKNWTNCWINPLFVNNIFQLFSRYQICRFFLPCFKTIDLPSKGYSPFYVVL